jgi:hypothetical protein
MRTRQTLNFFWDSLYSYWGSNWAPPKSESRPVVQEISMITDRLPREISYVDNPNIKRNILRILNGVWNLVNITHDF